MRVCRRVYLGQVFSEKTLKEGPSPAIPLRKDVRVKPLKEPGTQLRLGLASPEPSHPVFLKDVVACKHLIGPFTSEHNLKPVFPDKPGELKEGGRGCAKDRGLRVPDDLWENLPDILLTATDDPMVRFKGLNRPFLKLGFVKAVIREPHRKGAKPVIEGALHKGADICAVKTTAQVGSHGNICPQSDSCGIVEKFA